MTPCKGVKAVKRSLSTLKSGGCESSGGTSRPPIGRLAYQTPAHHLCMSKHPPVHLYVCVNVRQKVLTDWMGETCSRRCFEVQYTYKSIMPSAISPPSMFS